MACESRLRRSGGAVSSPENNIPVANTRIFARLKTARPYVPMALTLFPTKICLKFASVPGPEAHKYVIPPISCGSVAPLPIFSSPSLPPPSLSSPLLVTLATPYVFLRGCSSRRCTRGNAVNHLSRKKTQCNIPVVLLETPFLPLSFSSICCRYLLFPLFLLSLSLSLYFSRELRKP